MDKFISYAVGLINRLKNFRRRINQRTALRVIPVILILIGLVASVYLVQQRQIFRSRAAQEGQVEVVNQDGQPITAKDVQGNIQVGSPQVRLKITPPTWNQPSSQEQGFHLIKPASAQEGACGSIWKAGQTTSCYNNTNPPASGCTYLVAWSRDEANPSKDSSTCTSDAPYCWSCPTQQLTPTPTPASGQTFAPAVTQGITCESINGQCGRSDWVLRGSGATCSGSNRSYKGFNDGVNYTDCDTPQGLYPYCYTGCETAGGAALVTGNCRDLRPDETVRPPTDPEPVDSSKYIWKADCSRPCTGNSNCPQIDNGINPETSNWCYGFEEGKRCLQLQSIIQPTATPPPDVTDKIRISLIKESIDFRNSGVSCSPSQDPRQNCSELTYADLINQSIITWNLPDQPGIYPIWVSFYSAQKRYKEISITVNYLPGALESVQPPLGQVVGRIATIPKSILNFVKEFPSTAQPGVEQIPGIPPAIQTLGGQIVKVPAQPGKVVDINTPANAPVSITVRVLAREVPMFVRLQPELIQALPQPLVQGATAVAVLNLDFYRADTVELLQTHPQPVTISVQVTPLLLAVAQNNPNLLSIVRFDRERNEYLRLPTRYDAQRSVLSAETSETSTFSVVALPPRLALPAVDEPTALPGTDLVGYVPYLSKGVGGWNTGFQVGNLSDAPATVTIEYFWASDLFAGSKTRQKSSLPTKLSSKNPQQAVLAVQAVQIPPRQSFQFFGPTFEIEEGFQGSAVIRSDRPVSVIVNEIGPDGRLSASYAGTTRPSRVQYVPILMRENRGWNTELFVQNAGSAELTDGVVEIMSGETVVATVQVPTLPPGFSFRVDQALQEPLGTNFVGSARVRGSQPLATMVNQSNWKTLLSYSGFSGGQRQLNMPLITNDNRGWFTSLQVQNVGGRESEVTLYVAKEVADVVRIAAGGSYTWYPVPGTAPGFVGSATVVGEQGARLVGIVNELNLKKDSVQGMSYRAFTTGTDLIEIPLIMTDNYGWYTGIQVQNIGSTAATVTLSVNGETVEEVVIAAGQSKTWYPVPGTGQGFIGAATIEGSLGSQLVGIVNQVNLTNQPGDTSMAYEGTNR